MTRRTFVARTAGAIVAATAAPCLPTPAMAIDWGLTSPEWVAYTTLPPLVGDPLYGAYFLAGRRGGKTALMRALVREQANRRKTSALP